MGYAEATGIWMDPTPMVVHNLLIVAADIPLSYGPWERRLGYGIIDLHEAYARGLSDGQGPVEIEIAGIIPRLHG